LLGAVTGEGMKEESYTEQDTKEFLEENADAIKKSWNGLIRATDSLLADAPSETQEIIIGALCYYQDAWMNPDKKDEEFEKDYKYASKVGDIVDKILRGKIMIKTNDTEEV
jgi:ABC-type Zn uptake system ZnuABC Zn-binding protein ZnuA